jgi:hypothetical protein
MGMDFQGRKCKVFLAFFLDFTNFFTGITLINCLDCTDWLKITLVFLEGLHRLFSEITTIFDISFK